MASAHHTGWASTTSQVRGVGREAELTRSVQMGLCSRVRARSARGSQPGASQGTGSPSVLAATPSHACTCCGGGSGVRLLTSMAATHRGSPEAPGSAASAPAGSAPPSAAVGADGSPSCPWSVPLHREPPTPPLTFQPQPHPCLLQWAQLLGWDSCHVAGWAGWASLLCWGLTAGPHPHGLRLSRHGDR